MLAHAPHVAYTTFLVIFGCLGFLPVAALRAQLGPPALGVNLGYAITSEGARVVCNCNGRDAAAAIARYVL